MMDRAILILIFSFVLGILLSSIIFISPIVSVFIILIALAILAAEKIWKSEIDVEIILVAIALISFGLGSLRYAVKDFHESPPAGGPALEGLVVSEPEQRDNATRFVFHANNGERALVNAGLYAPIEYGDKVKLGGEFERPGVIANSESGRDFDYDRYLAKDDIYYTMRSAEVEVLESGLGNPVKEILYKVKRNFVSKIKETFAEPYASLLAGLIVSGRDAMPKGILEEFRRAGIIHIVVLSGYNITIIADFLRRVFEKIFLLSHRTAIPALASSASIAGIILFVLMTGAEATVVRASIMVLTVIVAKMLGRHYSASRALLVAGFVMLLENPKILVFDPSFQLSFLATLALIYVVPIVEKLLRFITDKWTLRTTIATTVSTQITVLPLLIYSIGDFSLVSLPANILVLLVIPYAMFLGFAAVTLAYLSALLALPLAYITHFILGWILGVSSFFGNMKFASIAVPSISIWLVTLVYLALFGVVIYLKQQKNGGNLSAQQPHDQ